jgi:ribosomal protein S18 acetylase RimI-like enzyme
VSDGVTRVDLRRGGAPERRGRGIGEAIVRLLTDHPGVRRARRVHLGTRDAMAFYERLGFVAKASIARPYASTDMLLVRTRAS